MSAVRSLKVHAYHLRRRIEERGISASEFQNFDSSEWTLLTAEVRTDSCKFVNSGWRRKAGEQALWIVIGLHETVETAFYSSKDGNGPDIVRYGALFDRVSSVNEALAARDSGPFAT